MSRRQFIIAAMYKEDVWEIASLRDHPFRGAVERIVVAALRAVEPAVLLPSWVSVVGDELRVANKTYYISKLRKITLIAIGKAALSMTRAWLSVPGMPVPHAGVVIGKHLAAASDLPASLLVMEGGHPLPDERSLRAGLAIREQLTGLHPDDLVVCLISGGGSALTTLPPPGVTWHHLQILTEALLRSGAAIAEMNVVRRHLDLLKGGGLARLAFPAHVLTLVLSDVPGNSLETIASGPTVPDATTVEEARAVLERYGLLDRLPPALLSALRETPKPGEEIFAKVQNVLIGSNADALRAAWNQARVEGFHTFLLGEQVQGEAREVALAFCRVLRRVHEAGEPVPRPACLLAGGETTVTLGATGGRGGRNQEFALAAVRELANLPQVMLIALATDGEDGPTDSAGAVVTGETAHRARSLGLDPCHALQQHDSYTFFSALGDGIKIGPTGTNVNDLLLFFAF